WSSARVRPRPDTPHAPVTTTRRFPGVMTPPAAREEIGPAVFENPWRPPRNGQSGRRHATTHLPACSTGPVGRAFAPAAANPAYQVGRLHPAQRSPIFAATTHKYPC